MAFNFQLNNQITYRDQRLRGPDLWRGLLLFMLVCGIGAVANVGIARVLYQATPPGPWRAPRGGDRRGMELRGLGDAGLARAVRSARRGRGRALAALTLFRLVVAAALPLSPDEAYYWVWSRALAPGYLDHPPMVALWIRAGTWLAGDSTSVFACWGR